MVLEELDSQCRGINRGPFPLTPTKIKSKSIINLSLKVKTIKLLKENIDVSLHNLGLGNGFLEMAHTKKI